jgi:hypothetical protein
MHAQMCFTAPAIGHEKGDDIAFRFTQIGDIIQAYVGAVQAGMPPGIIQASHMPAPFETSVQQEYLAEKLAHAPEIVLSLV